MTRSRTTALADHLRAQIADGVLPTGQKLPSEAQLIAEHGVSRTVVREALGRLQAEGLIHTRRGAGSYALTPPSETTTPATRPVRTPEERLQLIEFRLAVETEGAALAAERRNEAQLAALRTELESFSAAERNPAQAMRHDFRFHRLLAEASGNPFLLDAVDGLGSAMITMPRTRITGSSESDGDAAKRDASPPGIAAPAHKGKRHKEGEHATGRPEHTGTEDAGTRSTTPWTAAAEGAASSLSGPSAHRQAAQEHGQILAAVAGEDPRAAAAGMRTHLTASRTRLLRDAGI